MGNLLGAPVTEKETHCGVTANAEEYGVSSMQGWRVHMEDAHIAEVSLYAAAAADDTKTHVPGHSLFAVFDGHGGTFAATYAGKNFCRILSKQDAFLSYAKFCHERVSKEAAMDATAASEYIQSGLDLLRSALVSAFVAIDAEIAHAVQGNKVQGADEPYHADSNGSTNAGTATVIPTDEGAKSGGLQEGDSGTTACVVVLTPEYIVCANAGDSRSVLCTSGNNAVPLSFDHKPEDVEEERRIRAAGGFVAGGRVEGDLSVSRGLGDFRFKNMSVVTASPDSGQKPELQKISPIPDITVQKRNSLQDNFIIVACDGIWDVQANDDSVRTVGDMFQEGESNLGLICEEFCDVGLRLGSKDNMTVLIVKLAAQKIGSGGGVAARRQLREAVELKTKKQQEDREVTL